MNYPAFIHGLSGFIIVLALGAAIHSWYRHLKSDACAFAHPIIGANAYARCKLALVLLTLGIILNLLTR